MDRPQGWTPRGHGDPHAKLGFTPKSKGSEPGAALRPFEARGGGEAGRGVSRTEPEVVVDSLHCRQQKQSLSEWPPDLWGD